MYNFSRWPKSPEAKHTVNQELEIAREKIRKWAHVFPEMRIAHSNHDMRIMRKALDADLPSQVLKSFEDIFELPKEWQLKEQFIVMADKTEFMVCHGEEFTDSLQAALHYGLNVVDGHHHNNFGVRYVRSRHQQLWGMSSGCLIDPAAHAFTYGDKNKKKPVLGSALILNGIPFPVPLL